MWLRRLLRVRLLCCFKIQHSFVWVGAWFGLVCPRAGVSGVKLEPAWNQFVFERMCLLYAETFARERPFTRNGFRVLFSCVGAVLFAVEAGAP